MAQPPITSELEFAVRERREHWVARVDALISQMAAWSRAQGWTVECHAKTVSEKGLGTYSMPAIIVSLTGGQIMVNPIGLQVVGGNGRVDLEAIPTLARIKLIADDSGWNAYADPNVPLRLVWNQENFVRLAQDLLS